MWDWHRGDRSATLTLHSNLGERDRIPLALFFREPDDFFPFEQAALDLVRGRVLDVGAGTGVHALPLQRRGFEVTAVEILPEAVEILRERGVRRVVRGDLFEVDPGCFDTVLMLMNGIGPVGTLDGLDRFLAIADRWLEPGGQILVDSGEAVEAEPPARSPEDGWNWPSSGSGYRGEAWIRLEYRGEVGSPFSELYVDGGTFGERARLAGWGFQTVFEDETGAYLAHLTKSPRSRA